MDEHDKLAKLAANSRNTQIRSVEANPVFKD